MFTIALDELDQISRRVVSELNQEKEEEEENLLSDEDGDFCTHD